jgi:hypothetical protein
MFKAIIPSWLEKLAASRRLKLRIIAFFVILTIGSLWDFSDSLQAEESASMAIKRINNIHHSHIDLGFTDYLGIAREMHKRYLDIALDAAVATKNLPLPSRFYWTAESTVPVTDWWQEASATRRQQMLEAIQRGQIEITDMP